MKANFTNKINLKRCKFNKNNDTYDNIKTKNKHLLLKLLKNLLILKVKSLAMKKGVLITIIKI